MDGRILYLIIVENKFFLFRLIGMYFMRCISYIFIGYGNGNGDRRDRG